MTNNRNEEHKNLNDQEDDDLMTIDLSAFRQSVFQHHGQEVQSNIINELRHADVEDEKENIFNNSPTVFDNGQKFGPSWLGIDIKK